MLSGNRNFEGRVSPDVQANYLASPMLVVAYALAGTVNIDLTTQPIGKGKDGKDVFLRDIWPSNKEIAEFITKNVTRELFRAKYADVFKGDADWAKIKTSTGLTYGWNSGSTYVQNPPYFEGMTKTPQPVKDVDGARILALLGDKITTDHISPAGNITRAGPAGGYLLERQVRPADFNQYGTRRGNHEVMMRGTFANIRIKNFTTRDADGNVKEGGWTTHQPSGERMYIFDAAERYKAEGVPLVVFGGIEYGNGSSRDWAAKGTLLLGVRAVIAQSFERIHRNNLVGMGVAPFVYEQEGTSWQSLGLKGDELVTIRGLADVKPRQKMMLEITAKDGSKREVPVICRIDTAGGARVLPQRRHSALRAAQPGRGGLIWTGVFTVELAAGCTSRLAGSSPSRSRESPIRDWLFIAVQADIYSSRDETRRVINRRTGMGNADSRLRLLAVMALVALAPAAFGQGAGQQPPAGIAAMPAVLELFTSQGCSSCPAADALLKTYADRPGRDRAVAVRRLLGPSGLEGHAGQPQERAAPAGLCQGAGQPATSTRRRS